ncbi:hypothetical protein FRC02_006002 [Tulasnella sp. 418]|nr:hypothetical protein FRC02_006002 [Tulasnella sp. 418]
MPIINAPMNPQATPIVSPESELQRLRERVAIYERELQSFYNSPSSSNPSFSKAQSDLQIAIIRTKRQIAEQERRLNNPHSGAFKQEVKPEPKEEWPPFPLAQQHVPRVAPSPRGPQTAVHHTHNYNYEESESESDHEDFRAGDPFGAVINMLGTIGDLRPSPPTSAGRRGDDFNAFLIAAGNAETFEQDATIHDALKTLGMKHLDPAIPFKNMTVSLLPHQCIGVAWMTEQEKGRNQGGILADEMGLGKTIQILATCCFNRSRDPACKTTLVIVPVALLRQWKEEIEDKTKDGTALIYHGSSKNSIKSVKDFSKYDYVLTTFGTLGVEWPGNEVLKKTKKARKKKRDDFIEDDAEESDAPKKSKKKTNDGLLFQMYWYRVVLDEAQNVRNKGTRNSMAVTDLRAVYRWALTGTPLVNSTSDAYGLLRFLKIRPWYDWTDFRTEIQSLEKTNPKLATSRLQSIFKTCLLRRNKDSQLQGKRLIELPPKHHHLENLAFSPPEQAIYEMLQRRSRGIFNQYLRRGTVLKNYAHIFVLLLRLRQCAVHPALIGQFEDAFISEGEVRPTGEMEDPTAERERAAGIMGKVWVQAVREKYKMLAEERITLEKKVIALNSTQLLALTNI